MDGEGYGEGPRDVCVCILYLNLPTHCFWRDCYLGHLEPLLTVIQNSTWWRETENSHSMSVGSPSQHLPSRFVESYIQAKNSSRRLDNEHLRTICLHTSSPHWSDLTESHSCSDSHATAGHTFFRHLSLQFLFLLFQCSIVLNTCITKCLPVLIYCKDIDFVNSLWANSSMLTCW